jgi:excisionase family DNA binding protein
MTRENLLTVQEFADLIRVHIGTIYRRIREGRQPGVHRFGRDLRIDLQAAIQTPYRPLKGPNGPEPGLSGLYKAV